MKKIIAMSVIAAIACLLLSACSPSVRNTSTDSESNHQSNAEELVGEQGETIAEKYSEKMICEEENSLLFIGTSKEGAVKAANTNAASYLDNCVVEADSVAEWCVSENLSINIAKLHFDRGYAYYPTWTHYENGFWSCTPVFHKCIEIFGDYGISPASSCVSSIGEYTAIYLTDYDSYLLDEKQFGDNLQTEPIALEYQPCEDSVEESWWYFVFSDSHGNYAGSEVSIQTNLRGLFYVIKDMPEDYVFFCGEDVLTAKEIREILVQ